MKKLLFLAVFLLASSLQAAPSDLLKWDDSRIDQFYKRNAADHNNFVKLSGTQTIQGYKYFTSPIDFGRVTIDTATITSLTASTVTFTSATVTTERVTSLTVGSTGTAILFLSTGTYTPTLTNVTNITGSTAQSVKYLRVGNLVVVSGSVVIDPTTCAETFTELGLSLPLASNLAATTDLTGSATSISENPKVRADATNDRASFSWNCESDGGNQDYTFQFMYPVQ